MKSLVGFLLAVGTASPLWAERDGTCRGATSDILEVDKWSAERVEASDARNLRLHVSLRNVSGVGIRMVAGAVVFRDVLGRDMAIAEIDPDASLAPSGVFTNTNGLTITQGTDRLLTVAHSDVIAVACVWAVVYSDGTVERFDGL